MERNKIRFKSVLSTAKCVYVVTYVICAWGARNDWGTLRNTASNSLLILGCVLTGVISSLQQAPHFYYYRVQWWPNYLLAGLPNTMPSCIRHGVVAARLTSERTKQRSCVPLRTFALSGVRPWLPSLWRGFLNGRKTLGGVSALLRLLTIACRWLAELVWSFVIYRFDILKLNSVALVRTRTIPTERPPPVGEVSANFCG